MTEVDFLFPYCGISVKVVTYDRLLQSLNPLKTHPYKSTASLHSDLPPSNHQPTDTTKYPPYISFSVSQGCTVQRLKISIEHVTIFSVNIFLKVLLTWNFHQMSVTYKHMHTYKENKTNSSEIKLCNNWMAPLEIYLLRKMVMCSILILRMSQAGKRCMSQAGKKNNWLFQLYHNFKKV